jgi:hypothetical protein
MPSRICGGPGVADHLLILDGELDNTVPWAIAKASYK